MLKDCVAVVDIQTSHIDVAVGEKSVNGTFTFRARETVAYYTYFDGAFYDIKVLEEKLASLFAKITENSEISSIETVYVGVPGEFMKTLTKNYRITFNKPRRITDAEIKTLFDLAYDGENDPEFTLINRTAVYFVADELKTHSVKGVKCSALAARVSFNLVSNNYKEVLENIFSRIGVKTVKFLSVDLAEALYLFSEDERDACRILIDVGEVSCSLSVTAGDGLLYSAAFALGGGLIAAYLSEELKCDFDVSDELKRKLNLGLRPNTLSKYSVKSSSGEEYLYDRDTCNRIAFSVLDKIAESCDKAISACPLRLPSDVETAFTGGGVCFMRGAVEYLSTRLGVFPKIIAPEVPRYDKPDNSSLLSLLSVALDTSKNKLFYL